MVGVPRSTGCQVCIKRRVKCDTLQPECSQCQKYGVQCPGYVKARKFLDEGPLVRKRYARSASLANVHEAQGSKQNLAYSADSIDERLFPSLVSKSMSRQQPEVFRDFVFTAFPRWFGLNKYRVHVPWAVYVADVLGENPALDAALFCITSVFLGRSHYDSALQKSSREMYSKALVSLGGIIRHEKVMRSRESVSTSILLSLFEAYSQTREDSWVQHAAGAALLMSLRGAESHFTGFDRCLYLSFRSFLAAAAFIGGNPCLFEKPEWQTLIDKIRKQDMVDPRANATISAIVDKTDRLFMEVVKIPGLIYQTNHYLHASPRISSAEIEALITRIHHCKEMIQAVSTEIRLVAVMHYKNVGGRMALIGPIPSTLPRSFSNSVLRGTGNCFKILNLLLHNLTVYQHETRLLLNTGDSPSLVPTPGLPQNGISPEQPRLIPFRIVSRFHSPEESESVAPLDGQKMCPVDKWLDQVASSMGMGAFEVVVGE